MVKRIKANGRNGKKNGHPDVDAKIAAGIGRAMADAIYASKMGRPTKYKPEYAKQAMKICKLGATDVEIADFFEVSLPTVYAWSNTHADFFESIKIGKAPANERVKRSLYQKACGFWIDTEKIFCYEGQVIRVPTRDYYPPDTGAIAWWQKNREPELWRDKHEIEHGGKIEHRFTLEIFERDVGMKVIEGNAQEKKSIPRLRSSDA
jgi:hypothetical protein